MNLIQRVLGWRRPQFVDATDFGVVADGVTDNRAALQAAINAAASRPRCRVRVRGTIAFSGPVNVRAGVTGRSRWWWKRVHPTPDEQDAP